MFSVAMAGAADVRRRPRELDRRADRLPQPDPRQDLDCVRLDLHASLAQPVACTPVNLATFGFGACREYRHCRRRAFFAQFFCRCPLFRSLDRLTACKRFDRSGNIRPQIGILYHPVVVFGAVKPVPNSKDFVIQVETLRLK